MCLQVVKSWMHIFAFFHIYIKISILILTSSNPEIPCAYICYTLMEFVAV